MLTHRLVNELSGTMDLESTLVRAESLFRRFQRTVDTIDKKGNFPSAPQARQRKVTAAVAGPSDPSSSKADAQASGTDKGNKVGSASGSGSGNGDEAKVVSDELRALLSRKIEKVQKEGKGKEVQGRK